jgi:acyl-CoA thioesterase
MGAREFIAEKDRFARHLGIEILLEGPGYAKVRMPVKEEHLNGLDIVHGGATFALADLAFAVASNSHGKVAVAINANVSYMAAAKKGATLYAEAREKSRNHKLATYEVEVSDDNGELVAVFNGMVYRKKSDLPE